MAGTIAPIASIGVPREIKPDERRVALTPDAVRELVSHGLQVRIEQGAGEGAGISDAASDTPSQVRGMGSAHAHWSLRSPL